MLLPRLLQFSPPLRSAVQRTSLRLLRELPPLVASSSQDVSSAVLTTRTLRPDRTPCSRWSECRRPLFTQPASTTYDERKLIGYSPDQMFRVVSSVEDYHKFVPWCVKSTVVKRNPANYIECELEVGFQVFVERYVSKIRLNPPNSLTTMTEDSTLFHHLESLWKFDKGPMPDTCWLSFHVNFAFKSPLYKQVATVFFEEVVKRMMGAFIGRCRTLYGPSSLAPASRNGKAVKIA